MRRINPFYRERHACHAHHSYCFNGIRMDDQKTIYVIARDNGIIPRKESSHPYFDLVDPRNAPICSVQSAHTSDVTEQDRNVIACVDNRR